MRIPGGILVVISVLFCQPLIAADYPLLRESFHFDQTPRIITLQKKSIISNTVSIAADKRLLSADDFLLDAPSGTVKLLIDLTPPVDIEISYGYLGFDVQSCFYRRKLQRDTPRPISVNLSQTYASAPQNGDIRQQTGLRIFGSKSIGLRTGTGSDLELNQTLNIHIQGNLSDNLEVAGVLSDQSRPEIGGISTSLGEIDKVALRLSSESFSAIIGDIDYQRDFGSTARFRKALKGGSVALNTGDIKADATAGGIRSKHGMLKTFGRDGVSGPYRLLPDFGQTPASILPGTEKVWLDGRELTRGTDADYQIDYLQGNIIFSPGITITSRSRIEVDFEYLNESYRQDFYAGSFSHGDSATTIVAKIGFLSQSDSKSSPSRFDLVDSDIDLLAAAGDSSWRAVRSGVTKVDSGKGDYGREILYPDTVYQYRGPGNGDYLVDFSYVGQGNGDYMYTGGGIYEFVSRGGGAYLPVVQIPMPERSDAVSLSARVGSRAASVRFDGTLSNHDRNLYSAVDDDDNVGSDASGSVQLSPFAAATDDDLDWRILIEGRRSESEFFLPGRAYRVERGRTWGLSSDSIFNLAEQLSVSQTLIAGTAAAFNADWGVYRDRDYFEADRYGYSLQVHPLRSIAVGASRVDRKSHDVRDLTRFRLYENDITIRWNSSRLEVSAGWNDESDLRMLDVDVMGRRFDRYNALVGYSGLTSRISYEAHHLLAANWLPEYDSRDFRVGYSGYGGLGNSQANVDFTVRRVHRLIPDRQNESQLQATVDYDLGGYGSPLDLSLNYRVSRIGVDSTSERFIKLGEGEGNYRLENGIYVPDPLGDYIRVVEVLDIAGVGVTVDRGIRLRSDLANWKGCPRQLAFAKRILLETNIRTSEQADADEPFGVRWIVPYIGVSTRGRYNLRKSFRQTARAVLSDQVSLFLSFDEERIERPRQTPASASYKIGFVERIEAETSSKTTYSIEHRFKRLDETSLSLGDASFEEHQVRNTLRYRFAIGLELIAKPSYLIDRSRQGDLSVTMWEAAFEANQRLKSSGRISFEFAYQSVASSRIDRFVPFQYAAGRRVGDNFQWGVTAELSVSRSISARLSYDGESIPQLETRHVSSVSVKARF